MKLNGENAVKVKISSDKAQAGYYMKSINEEKGKSDELGRKDH